MGTTNYGTQTKTLDYKQYIRSSYFNTTNYKLHQSGIYEGGILSKINDTTVQISTFTAYINDESHDLGIRISTAAVINFTVSPGTPYIILRFVWSDTENNFADIIATDKVSILQDDIVIGRCVFDGSTMRTTFDLSLKKIIARQRKLDEIEAFNVYPNSPADDQVNVVSGSAYINSQYVSSIGGVSPTISSTTLGRIDIVYIDNNGDIQVKEGVDNGSPSIPLFPSDGLPIAYINRGASRTTIEGDEIERIYVHRSFNAGSNTHIENLSADKNYTTEELNRDTTIFADISSNNITIGLFNYDSNSKAIFYIYAIGSTSSTYKLNIELFSSGTADYELPVGDTLIVIADGTWYTLLRSTDSKRNIYLNETQSLIANRKFFITENSDGLYDYTLPDSPQIGDEIELAIDENTTAIVKQNSNEIISENNKYFTTEGTTGQLILNNTNILKLLYKGSGYKFIEPGVKLSDPANIPASNGIGCAISFSSKYVAIGYSTSPYLIIYKRSGDTFTKLTDPATMPTGNVYDCSFSNDDTYLAVAHTNSPYVTIYKRSGDTFTKLSDPGTLPTGDGRGICWSPDTTYLSVTHISSPRITIYKRSGDTFTKLTNPATIPPNTSYGCSFSPDNNYLATVHIDSPYVTIYKRSEDTFTKITNPATLPTGDSYACFFSFDNNYLAVAHDTSPYITIYKRSGDTFTKLTNPATLPAGGGRGICFSYNSLYLAISHITSPYVTIYKRSGDTFTKLSDPATLPTGQGEGCSYPHSDSYLVISHQNSPYVTIYKTITTVNKKWIVKKLQTIYPDTEKRFNYM